MVPLMHAIFAGLMSLAVAPVVDSHEQPLALHEVPQAVSQSATKRFPRGEQLRFSKQISHGKAMYSVKLRVARGAAALCIAPSGEIALEEREVSAEDLPQTVQKSLAASGFATAQVTAALRVFRPGQDRLATYDILVRFGGTQHEVMFDGAGFLVLGTHAETCINTAEHTVTLAA